MRDLVNQAVRMAVSMGMDLVVDALSGFSEGKKEDYPQMRKLGEDERPKKRNKRVIVRK